MEIRVETGKPTSRGSRDRVLIGGALTIYEVGGAKSRLLAALRGAAEVEVDLSRVEEIDTAGIQLLVMLKREALASGKVLRLSAHSAAALDALDAYNLATLFGDPVVLSSRRRPGRNARKER